MSEQSTSLIVGDCDAFVFAMEKTMERSGQGIHLSQSILELGERPDLDQLRRAMQLLVERHPILTYQPRYPFPFVPPTLSRPNNPASAVPLGLWSEKGSPETLLAEGASEIESFESLSDQRLNGPKSDFHSEGKINLRCDLIERARGDYAMIFTWRHILFDGVGAELLTCEAAALGAGDESSYVKIATRAVAPPGGPDLTLHERWQRARPMVKRLSELMERPFKSLSGPIPVAGKNRFEVEPLTEEQTKKINARAAEFCGPLFTMPYFLACATIAHHEVWKSRGSLPESYLVCLPLQLRKANARGPLFQNQVTMLFLSAKSDLVADIAALCKTFQDQHAHALKNRLLDAFRQMQYLMRRIPPRLYIAFLLKQMRGEITSFYHSNTGEFAADLEEFYGATIENAYHVPCLYNPPGSGVFCSTKRGRMTVAMTWREGVLTAEERSILKSSFIAALLGENSP